MSKQRRTFSAEFNRDAAAVVLDQGYSHLEASRSLGGVESVLRRWVRQLSQERHGVTPQSKALTPEQQKIQELEAKISRLEREKAILNKATTHKKTNKNKQKHKKTNTARMSRWIWSVPCLMCRDPVTTLIDGGGGAAGAGAGAAAA